MSVDRYFSIATCLDCFLFLDFLFFSVFKKWICCFTDFETQESLLMGYFLLARIRFFFFGVYKIWVCLFGFFRFCRSVDEYYLLSIHLDRVFVYGLCSFACVLT